MRSEQVRFDAGIPAAYRRWFQPLLFDPVSAWFAARVVGESPSRILETACGAGSLTGPLASALYRSELVATDIEPRMITLARESVTARFGIADAQALPFREGSFDSVVCQFGYMFFPDKPLSLREARRVLRVGGSLHLVVWGPIEENQVAMIARDAILPFVKPESTIPFERPYGFHNPEPYLALFAKLGFGDGEFESFTVSGGASTPEAAASAYCLGTPIAQDLLDAEAAHRAVARVYRAVFGDEITNHNLSAVHIRAAAI